MSITQYTAWILFHLWRKSHEERSKGLPPQGSILIPTTVIYRWAQPQCSYFSTPDGYIRRRKRDRLSIEGVGKGILGDGTIDIDGEKIVASALYEQMEFTGGTGIGKSNFDKMKKSENTVLVEYLNDSQFRSY